MKKLISLIFGTFILTLFSGCMSQGQAAKALDLILGKPKVVSVEPKNKAKDVALDAKIKIKFNQDMDETSLNNKTVIIDYFNDDLDFYINPFLDSEFSYNSGEKTLTIMSKDGFLPNQEVEVKLSSEIKNKKGRELSHFSNKEEGDKIRYVFKFKIKGE